MAEATSLEALASGLKRQAHHLGFDPVGIAALPAGERLRLRSAALERWLQAGHQADMGWMADPRRRQVEALLPGCRSLLAVGLSYYVRAERQPGALAVARYGWGRDYHRLIDGRLRRLGRWLEGQWPTVRWRACVDSAPLMDKAWAEEAGLGWIGKHGNLIHRQRGSWLLLGHLLTNLDLPPDRPATPLCGSCSRCIPACPTGAIVEPFVVDSRRCIAYHTIENRDPELPAAIAAGMGPWVAGCDICQEACPWNQQPLASSEDPDLQPRPWLLDLREGFSRLADWLGDVEGKWAADASRGVDGRPKMTLGENLDYHHKLGQQFPIRDIRVAYAKAGTLFASTIIQDARAVIDHKAYWASARSLEEARYMIAILNCDAIRLRIADRQSKGQGGARDFDNLMWELPIPEFSPRDPLHLELAALAENCEAVAAATPLDEAAYFTTNRKKIREALEAAGLMARLDALVAQIPGL